MVDIKRKVLVILSVIITCSILSCSHKKGSDDNLSKESGSINPINLESDQIAYINYIRDRGYMGELTNLCYYVEDQEKIKEILDCIDNDITFQSQVEDGEEMYIADGNSSIHLEIFLDDGTEHNLRYLKDYINYDGINYRIYSNDDLLSKVWINILTGYEPIEIE